MTPTLTLTDFLLARIAEDEEIARAATAGPWRYEVALNPQDTGHHHGAVMAREHFMPDLDATSYEAVVDGYTSDLPYGGGQEFDPTTLYAENGEHIARHDPARVLAECEAKHGAIEAAWGDHMQIEGEWGTGRDSGALAAANDYPDVLRWLALPYADHPDYREEWRA